MLRIFSPGQIFIWMLITYPSPNAELSRLLQGMVCGHQCFQQLFCAETLLPQEVLRFLSASKIEVLSVKITAEDLLQNLPSTERGFSESLSLSDSLYIAPQILLGVDRANRYTESSIIRGRTPAPPRLFVD